MAGETLMTVTDENFEQITAGTDVPVVMYFGAEWCLPCKIVSPVIEEFAAEYKGKVKFAKLDADYCKEAVKQYKVFSIPTVMVFKDGKETERLVGSKHKDELEKVIRRYI